MAPQFLAEALSVVDSYSAGSGLQLPYLAGRRPVAILACIGGAIKIWAMSGREKPGLPLLACTALAVVVPHYVFHLRKEHAVRTVILLRFGVAGTL